MKIEIFTPVSYTGPVRARTWPAPPRCYDPAAGMDSIARGLEQCAAAHEAGFDSLNFAEHHYSTAQLSPDPISYAVLAGQQLPAAVISVLGTNLPLHNPVRIAESYALLDNLLGGRLGSIGLLRGTPNEYLTYGTSPWSSREAFAEAVELVIRAMTEPEPFGWEGRHYRFRNISIWPQPVQRPRPRILLSGNSPASARLAATLRCDIGFSFMSPERCAENAAAYREAAAAAGWEPGPDNILYRHYLYLAGSDEQAARDVAAYGWPGLGSTTASADPELASVLATVGAAMAGTPPGRAAPGSLAGTSVTAPPISGGPETVLAQLRVLREVVGAGRVEIIVVGGEARFPHELVLASLGLMGKALVPALHAEEFGLS